MVDLILFTEGEEDLRDCHNINDIPEGLNTHYCLINGKNGWNRIMRTWNKHHGQKYICRRLRYISPKSILPKPISPKPFCRRDFSPKRHFTEGILHRRAISPKVHFPEGYFANIHFAEIHFTEAISQNGHFTENDSC